MTRLYQCVGRRDSNAIPIEDVLFSGLPLEHDVFAGALLPHEARVEQRHLARRVVLPLPVALRAAYVRRGIARQIARRKAPSGSSSAYSAGGAYSPPAHGGRRARGCARGVARAAERIFRNRSRVPSARSLRERRRRGERHRGRRRGGDDRGREPGGPRPGSPPRQTPASPERASSATTYPRHRTGRGVPRDALRASPRATDTASRDARLADTGETRARAQTVAIAPAPA